jgi:cell wall-associated NlpC family hydrolase
MKLQQNWSVVLMSKTNTGLVAYCKAQLGKPYWYGTFGNKATQSLLDAKKKQYPYHYGDVRMNKYKSQLGSRVHDCVGLVKGYLWSVSPTATPKYKSAQDVSANGMLKVCKEKGNIKTLPEIPGILVFMNAHVGVYIGNGKVIEAKGFNYGVVETRLEDRNWVNWGKCPWIKYPSGNYFVACDPKATSIVDALKKAGEKSDVLNRRKIAVANGIKDYIGTAKQNIQLLDLMKKGKLMKP